ncbi:MAG: 2'-5' RNA ligase family protein [Bacteroidota bacterium]|nr:2'-5' RNA ligase family protein [Bacteroidota bacterium]
MDALYFIAIVVPPEIDKKIIGIKEYISLHYKSKAALNAPGHITLHMPFKWNDIKGPLLHEKLTKFSQRIDKFTLCLAGFKAFAPRVIFVDVEENESLQNLQKQLLRFSKTELNLFNGNYKEGPFHPHVTVAFRDLKKNLFYPAFNEFKDKNFEDVFQVDHITLLKHNGKRWEIEKEFLF